MAKRNKDKPSFNQPDMPSGINIMGMGGTGEKSFNPNSAPKQQIDTHQLMKGNAQTGH